MKKNDWIFALSVAAYSYLFWQQLPGVNFIVMNLLLLGGIILNDKNLLRNKRFLFVMAGALITSCFIYLYGNMLSVCGNLVSLLLVSSFTINRNNSVFVALMLALGNTLLSIAFMITDAISRRNKNNSAGSKSAGKKFMIVLIALCVAVIFLLMYRSANILFYELTEKLNLSFISPGWIFFTITGAILTYSFYYQHKIGGFALWEASVPDQLEPATIPGFFDKLLSMDSERFSGIVLLILLNALLLVVNILDIRFLISVTGQIPENSTYSEYVHQGVGMLIFSVICAMLIILFYFRGRMNFDTNGRLLRALALFWILQNAFMIISTAFRNDLYVTQYGFTYKRLGVYYYLLMTLIGIAAIAIKVNRRKTNAFLFRSTGWIYYPLLILSCFVNWDAYIADFNLYRGRINKDTQYLSSLSWRAWPALQQHLKKYPDSPVTTDYRGGLYLFLSRQKEIRENYKWQSHCLARKSAYDIFTREPLTAGGTDLAVTNSGLREVFYFPVLANSTFINFEGNDLTDVSEVRNYRQAKQLYLNNNPELISVAGVAHLSRLEELNLKGTRVTDFWPVLNLKKLKQLTVTSISKSWIDRIKRMNPGIVIETITVN
ncbi:MAG TPA: DUF4173 domain-containing protein [Bacteroidia bacterium]|nr:DUF4173 domain-containing protein [Bacteroidia bacterium]